MAKSDYGIWFISKDGTQSAIKCNRERFMDCLVSMFGGRKAMELFPLFRRATFSENCKYELSLLED